jgi:hypothetical protein
VEVQVLSAAPKNILTLVERNVILEKLLDENNLDFIKFAPVAQLDRAFDYGSKG